MNSTDVMQEKVVFATESDYAAGREFCEFAISVSTEGIAISAKKPLRISFHKQTIVSGYEGLMLSTLPLNSARLGVAHLRGQTPLRERCGFLLDYAENLEEAKAAAVDIALGWRNDLVRQLAMQIDELKNAPTVVRV